MKNARTLTALLVIVTLGSLPVLGGNLEPLTVSPGAADRLTGVEARCPTFSWQAVPGAVGYEVVVYELPLETELAAWNLDEAVEVLFVELPVGVTAWTPSFEDGLVRRADHVWFVRGVYAGGGEDATEWSVARFFRVAGGEFESGIGIQSREVRQSSGTETETETGEASSRGTEAKPGRKAMAERVGETKTKDIGAAMAAIRGEMPDATGETYGVVGISNSLEGGGLGAVNTTEGPDLVLDGVANGRTDLRLFDWGLDRSSPDVEVFGLTNEGGGSIDLWVQGDVHAVALIGDGAGVTNVDAETLDGIDSTAFSPLAHLHDGRYFTETELNTSGGGGSVHWDNLATVPTGFADGIDHDTTYSAGAGMQLVGTQFRAMGTGYAKVVVVAASGGDFTSIQAAIDNITTSGSNPYLVWVAPGSYNEVVTMKPHVHLQGAGQGVTTIWSSVGNPSPPPSQATLMLASDTSVRDLTVSNLGTDAWNVAVMGSAGVTDVVLADVSVLAQGSSGIHYFAIVSTGGATEITLEDVMAESSGGSGLIFGLKNELGATAVLRGGSFVASGGDSTFGVSCIGSGSTLDAAGITATGENGSSENRGLFVSGAGAATLRTGLFSARGGSSAIGISSQGLATNLEAIGVTATGEDAISENHGMLNDSGLAKLRGSWFMADGGLNSYGIENTGMNSILNATNVTASAVGGSVLNFGFSAGSLSESFLHGGSFSIDRSLSPGYGIFAAGNVDLEVVNVVAEGYPAVYVSDGIAKISHSLVDGGVSSIGTSDVDCYVVCRQTFVNLDPTGLVCPNPL